jgi:hypothetical protein
MTTAGPVVGSPRGSERDLSHVERPGQRILQPLFSQGSTEMNIVHYLAEQADERRQAARDRRDRRLRASRPGGKVDLSSLVRIGGRSRRRRQRRESGM